VSRLACADSYSIFDKAAKPNGQRSLNFSGFYGGISSYWLISCSYLPNKLTELI